MITSLTTPTSSHCCRRQPLLLRVCTPVTGTKTAVPGSVSMEQSTTKISVPCHAIDPVSDTLVVGVVLELRLDRMERSTVSWGHGVGKSAWLQINWKLESQQSTYPEMFTKKVFMEATGSSRILLSTDPSVLCFVQWTEELTQSFSSNEIFLSNLTSLNSTLSQYVGTDSRLLRFYPREKPHPLTSALKIISLSPASDWSALSQCNRCPLTLQDTFELGRRPW